MKVLSLKQPWAELVLQGRKKIELRKWNTNFRGKFLIHASKNVDGAAMKEFGFVELPLGKIVGKVFLTEVKKYDSAEEFEKDSDLHLASSDWGLYGFILEGVSRVEEISCKGKLGFWDFDGEVSKT